MDREPILADAEDRDPRNYNDFLKVAYSDVICEPSAAHSPQCAYQFTKTIYDGTVLGTYWVLTILLGGLLSFLYGLICGSLSFLMVWFFTPFVRICLIQCGPMAKVWLFCVKCFYDPYFESCGRCFSNVNINFNHATRTIQHV